MATVSTNDLIANKLAARYPGVEKSGTALLQRYRLDQNLDDWAEYVAHVAAASASAHFADDQNAFWNAFVP